MMKLRLRAASVSSLITGGKRSISEAVSAKPKLPFSNGDVSNCKSHTGFKYFINSYSTRRISHLGILDKFSIKMTSGEMLSSFPRYGVQGVQNLKCSLHSSSDQEDDFSELGLLVSKGGGRLHSSSDQEDDFSELGLPLSKGGGRLHSSSDQEDDFSELGLPLSKGGGRRSQLLTEKAEAYMLKQNNYPSRKPAHGLAWCAKNIKHSNHMAWGQRILESDSEDASKDFLPISDLPFQENITIRINNIGKDTSEASIHSVCMTCGPLEGLKTKEGAVDVFFTVKDASTTYGIIKKLNDTVMDGCRWSAKLVCRDSISTARTNTDIAQFRAGSQVTTLLSDLRMQFELKEIYYYDLALLLQAVLHLEDGEAAC